MNNEILFVLSVPAVFGSLVLVNRAFGRAGLFAWAALVPVLANILTAKQITVFGLDATLGTILFASVFLCGDVLSELYGKREARKAALIGAAAIVGYIVATQVALLYSPNELDYVHGAMGTVFGLSLRVSVASLVCFLLSNIAGVYLFDLVRRKAPRFLWLRNNVSTLTCNAVENFIMMFAAFYGVYSIRECVMIATATSCVEIVVGLLDTPFLYAAVRWKNEDATHDIF